MPNQLLTPACFRFMIITVFACILLIQGCKKSNGPSPSNPVVPANTDKGVPTGAAVSASIGAAGGSLSSADGRVTINIPAGALDASTTISIQPITNNAPLGVEGMAYRFTPDGQTFKTPAKLVFNYSYDSSSAELFWIVTQAKDGSWLALRKTKIDTLAQTATGEISHFSDWGLGVFMDLSLDPNSRSLKPGESVTLKVNGFEDVGHDQGLDQLAPLTPVTPAANAASFVPLTPDELLSSFKLIKWKLAGEGTLTSNAWSATYKAPSTAPNSRNPVAISVELDRYDFLTNQPAATFRHASLVSNIMIVDPGELLVFFDGKKYVFTTFGKPGDNTASILVQDFVTKWEGISCLVNCSTQQSFDFKFIRPPHGTYSHPCKQPDYRVEAKIDNELYGQEWYDDKGNLHCAGFTSRIVSEGRAPVIDYSNPNAPAIKPGLPVLGTFSGYLYDSKGGLHQLNGYFNLPRIQ